MNASDWTKILFVLLLVVGFGLPFAVYFVDVYKGVQAFPVPKRSPKSLFWSWRREGARHHTMTGEICRGSMTGLTA